jgi:hypothetical protein
VSKNNKVVFKFSINKEEVKVRKLNNLKPTKFFKDKSKYNRKEFKLNKKSLDSFSFYIYIYIPSVPGVPKGPKVLGLHQVK